MTPLPPALLARFPQQSPRFAERPWWRIAALREWGVVEYVRPADGTCFAVAPRKRTLTPGGGASLDPIDLTKPPEDVLAEIDRRYPLPHPGFRSGQVWAGHDPSGVVSAQIVESYEADAHDMEHAPGHWLTLAIGPGAKLSDTLGDRRPIHIREDRLREQFAPWFLMADPACPHLAPWAPA